MREAWWAELGGAELAAELAHIVMREIPNTWSAKSFEEQLGRDGNTVWVVRRDRLLVGFLLVERVLDELNILNIAVAQDVRRQGVARELLTRAFSDASDSGVDVVHLELRASNTVAKALYEEFGFVVVGSRPRYYERREDAVLMSLKLRSV